MLALASCSGDVDVIRRLLPNDGSTIADFVASNEDYSFLAAALEKTRLTATLGGDTV
ncbi:MAG: hypothetical protein H0X63_01530 [Flavobacteriales bacterium]|nr:hypothetical protein [Flavobacteriales bacterium]